MRVAVVTQYFPTSQQVWAGHSAYQTLRLLAQMCEVRVFYPEATYPAGLVPAAARRPPLDRSWQPEGVNATYIPYPTLPVLGRPVNGFTMAHRLLPHVRAYQPDVVLNYVVYPDGLAAVRIAHALGIPAVLTAIGSDLNRIPGRLVRALTRWTLRHADCVTTVSRDLGATAVALGSDAARTTAILNGCDTNVFHPKNRIAARKTLGLDPRAEIVLYVGRLDVRKGLIELIEAMAELRTRRPRIHCYVVGDGPDRPLLVEAITRIHAADSVTLVAPCPTAQVAGWMAAADLVTLPSYREGCPNVVLEALAAGRPVVATDVGGIPELMDSSCGRLVPAQNAAALAKAVEQTLSRSWDAETISSKHSRGWPEVAADLFQVLARANRKVR